MKAAIFYEKEDLRLETAPDPPWLEDEVVIRVNSCGICGSDLEYFYARSPLATATGKGPLILGHEFTGEVIELGRVAEKAGTVKLGDRVVVNPIQSCNACDKCRAGTPQFCTNLTVLGVSTNGGFAEYAVSKYHHVYRLPEEISYDTGALIEPLAAALHAVDKLEVNTDSYVVIFGPGPLGLVMVNMVKARGARKVVMIGTRDYRLEKALDLGADAVINSMDPVSPYYSKNLVEAIRDIGRGELANRVIVPTSSLAAHDDSFKISAGGAILVFMAVTGPTDKVGIPMLESLILDKQVRFSLWYPNKFPKTIDYLEKHASSLSSLITHTGNLEILSQSIRQMSSRTRDPVKIMIHI